MALSQDCWQQRDREQAFTQRWLRWGVLGAVGLHGGLLPLVGAATDATLSPSESNPIQIVVAAADSEATLAESATPPLAAAPSTQGRSAGSPPGVSAAAEPDATEPELEAVEPEPEAVEPEPEAVEPEPEPVATEPEPVATEPEADPEVSEASDVAETAEAIPTAASEPDPSPEPIAASAEGASGGDSETAPVALAAAESASEPEDSSDVGSGDASEPTDSAGSAVVATGLGRLLDGYFPDGEAGEDAAGAEAETVARGSGLGDRGPGNAAQTSPGQAEGSGTGRRTISCRSCARPSYPAAALEAGIEGEPKVAVQFDANGTVVGVVLEQSSGNAALDQAALAAAQRWRFDTGGQGGAVSVAIPFVIEGSDRHREAQRQGDRETVTVPDTGTAARRAPGGDPAAGAEARGGVASPGDSDDASELGADSQDNTADGGNGDSNTADGDTADMDTANGDDGAAPAAPAADPPPAASPAPNPPAEADAAPAAPPPAAPAAPADPPGASDPVTPAE